MADNYPFIFTGTGIGKPYGYSFECYAKFRTEPDDEQKKEITNSIPDAASETVCWYGGMLYFGDADFGATLKMTYEPEWYKNVDAEIAGNKDLELWTKPIKKTLEQFHSMFDKWVYALNTAYPLDFFIKQNKIAKKEITPWNKWSIERAVEPACAYCFEAIKDAVEDEDKRRIHSILEICLMYFLEQFKPQQLSESDRESIWKFYTLYHEYCDNDEYAAIFMSFPRDRVLQYLREYQKNPAEHIIHIATAKEGWELLLDDEYFALMTTVFKKAAEADSELLFLFSSNPMYECWHPDLFTKIDNIKKKDRQYIKPIARMFELAVLAWESNRNKDKHYTDYEYLENNELFYADGYFRAASLYYLDSDIEKSKDLLARGLKLFGHEQLFINRGKDLAKAVGSDELLKMFENQA